MTEVKSNKEKERNNKIVVMLILFIAICLLCTLCFSCGYNKNKVLKPDYAPQEIETNIEKLEENENKMVAPDGGGAVSIQYTKDVRIDLSDKKAYINYKNPSKSTHNIILQIVIQNEVIAQSGLIPPGYQLTEIDILNNSKIELLEGVYKDAEFKILSYNPETREKAMIDTELMIEITVQK